MAFCTVLITISAAVLIKAKFTLIKKILFLFIPIAILAALYIWYTSNRTTYLINQGEMEMLWRLSLLPSGKVMVYDNECLQCEYFGDYKPPAYANKRGYVGKYGQNNLVYNRSVFDSRDQKEAGEEFSKTGAEYVYLVKYGGYTEKLPFSPGDLGVKKLYDNAYAEIWEKVE